MYKNQYYLSIFRGLVIGLIIYNLEIYWFHTYAGNDFAEGTTIREWKFIFKDGTEITRNDIESSNYMLYKHMIDFMIAISYGLEYCSWNWTMFELWNKNEMNKVFKWTLIFLISIFSIYPISYYLLTCNDLTPFSDIQAFGIRHMNVEVNEREYAVYKRYLYLFILSLILNKFNIKQTFKNILFSIFIGCTQAFIMILPLYTFKIRRGHNSTLNSFIYEVLYLINQGTPLTMMQFLLFDKCRTWYYNYKNSKSIKKN